MSIAQPSEQLEPGKSSAESASHSLLDELSRQRELLELAVDLSPVGKLAVDSAGNLVLVNREIERMFGYTRDELLGKPIELLLPIRFREGHPGLRASYSQTPQTRRMGTGRDLYGLRKDGSEVPVEIGLSPVYTAEGLYVLSSVVDLTARRENEQRMRQAQKMEAIGTLASGIAHDFNNILLGIIGYAELLVHESALGGRAREDVNQILRAASRGRELVKRILTFSRHNDVSRVPLSPVGAVTDTLRFLRSSIPAAVTLRDWIDPATPQVFSQETLLSQIVMNLTTNAAHAMSNGGVVEVELGPSRVETARYTTAGQLSPGLYCRIRVRDTGTGIEPSILSRIFEPFFTTKPPDEGTGLGLSVVLGIVEIHNGAIDVETSHSGTSVAVYLPSCEAAAKETGEAPSVPQVLVVDDEAHLAGMMARTLRLFGLGTTDFSSSLEALEAFRAKPGSFDLVVADNNMSHLTGLELAASIREVRPDIPVLIVSGLPEKSGVEEQQSVSRFLSKPFTVNEFGEVLEELLGELPCRDVARAVR